MSRTLRGFKKFVFEDMDPSNEKDRDAAMGKGDSIDNNQDYFGALEDEEGIKWEDLSKVLEAEPWVSDHFDLGKMQHKLSAWQIVNGSLSQNGASIRLRPQSGDRASMKGPDGVRLNKSKYQDRNQYHLDRKELIKFLTTGWTPAVQAAQGAGASPM